MPSAEELRASLRSGGSRGTGAGGAGGAAPTMNWRVAEIVRNLPKSLAPIVDLALHFPDASPASIDLLRRMLVFDPRKRISVEEALAHPWLADLHARAPEPTCEVVFDFSFEHEYVDEMPMDVLQAIMFQELKEASADATRRHPYRTVKRNA